ncbi:MAG: sigma-54-dependent Fis family transcriptional regulator, partial [Planctomycetes bacterium]|nr:sigma-54-dependent Fis family transcriptional regulator [Planctomycetota bacterium]
MGYTVLVVQAIEGSEAPADEEENVRTVELRTSYVRGRDELPVQWDRLALWAEGFDQMRAAKDEREAAEVILQQLVRHAAADHLLLAFTREGSPKGGCRELAACGLSAGEIERLVRWFNEVPPKVGVQTPVVRDVTGENSGRRVVIGRADVDGATWLFYLDLASSTLRHELAARCMAVVAHLLELYRVFQKQRGRERQVDQLSESLRLCVRPDNEDVYRMVASRFVFRSAKMRDVCQVLARVARVPSPVLLMGEPGTGKQIAAEAIHAASLGCDKPLVGVSIVEYPESLVEGELFGHSEHAFTGAADRTGLIEEADGGTLFLDEIGEIPAAIQAKLLRVLEHGEFRRLGENAIRSVDIRLVSATNRDLAQEVRAGRFRQDLYDRISVIPIVIPPLRERLEDIPPLAETFLRQFNERMGKSVELTFDGLQHLSRYTWPDNVRGLKNYIERTVALADYGPQQLGPDELPPFAPPPDTAAVRGQVLHELIETLRQQARGNQARILSEFCDTATRLPKKEWAHRLGISQPVFRAELRGLVAYALDRGIEPEFFESRVQLRSEDWR